MYCSPIDLIAHTNRARLIGQLAGKDHGAVIEAQAVQDYFLTGIFVPEQEQDLRAIASRVEQAIENATGDIKGYTALFPAITLPAETLKTACMDLALFRLHENLAEDNIIRLNAEKWISYFDKIATGKISINADDDAIVATGSAQTIGDDLVFTAETLAGY